jgi:hypothetical protein
MRAVRIWIAVILLALAAGCGGEELSGEADVPDGYATYRGEGVSFAHPDGFEAEARTNANGVEEVTLRDPSAGDGAATIHLTVAPERGDDIEPLARSVRVATESIAKGEVGDEREVDVAGAVAARRMDISQPAPGGATVDRESLLVLAPDQRFYILSASGEGLDRDAVIRSFRLEEQA